MDSQMYKAFTGDFMILDDYLMNTSPDKMRSDFRALITEIRSQSSNIQAKKAGGFTLPNGLQEQPPQVSQLEAFTMAAMTGLASYCNPVELTVNEVESIAHSAAEIAQRTLYRLSELS